MWKDIENTPGSSSSIQFATRVGYWLLLESKLPAVSIKIMRIDLLSKILMFLKQSRGKFIFSS